MKKTAAALGALLGAGQIISITGRLFAGEPGGLTVTTELAGVDAESLNSLMDEIEGFGEQGRYDPLFVDVYKEGMELSQYVRQCSHEIEKRYPLHEENDGSYDAVVYARYCDSYLTLLVSLVNMMGLAVFIINTGSSPGLLSDNDFQSLHAHIGDIWSAIEYLKTRWKTKKDDFIYLDDADFSLREVVLANDGRHKKKYYGMGIWLKNLKESIEDIAHPSAANHFMGIKQSYFMNFVYDRHKCKAIFIRYSLLRSFEIHYDNYSTETETVNENNEITSGETALMGKALCAILFLELAVTRMKLLSLQGRSGIFTMYDRQLFQMECSCLIQTVKDITERPSFAGRPIFSGDYGTRPALFNTENGKRGIVIAPLNTVELGMHDERGMTLFSVSTPFGARMTLPGVDEALEKLRRERENILGVKG